MSASLQGAAHELSTSKLLVGISSGISFFGAMAMIAHYLVFPESRRCGRRLLFMLHVADGLLVLGYWYFFCPRWKKMGYLLVFFQLASCLWTACFAFHLFQLLARRYKAPELYEGRYHLVAWGIPIATVSHLYAQSLAGTNLVGESGRPWCWIRSWSDGQWSEQGFYVQLVIFYSPVVLTFLHNLVTYVMLLYLMDNLSTNMETRIHYRLLLYTWAFFLPNVWIVFAFAYQAVVPTHVLNAPLLYLISFFTPLQGAMNAVVYGMNHKEWTPTVVYWSRHFYHYESVASFVHGNEGSQVQPRKSVWNLRSRAFRHAWTTFIKNECHSLLPLLLELLPAAAIAETMELKKGLCLSTNTGQRPSFENAQARSGYIQQKINRCGNLPNLLLTEELSDMRSEMFRMNQSECCNMALYGGGPAFDAIGLLFMREYFRASDVKFKTTVYDNEPGWKCAIDAVTHTMRKRNQHNIPLDFQHCDITLDVHMEENEHVHKSLHATQLHVFSFVCVENFCLLRDSCFIFLRSLFERCKDGSYFIFTDSTHRLWPTIFNVANTVAPDQFRIWTPFARSCHYALVLQKLPAHSKPASTYPFYTSAMAKLQEFHLHQEKHLETMKNHEF
ncbi:LOW QUALITY PROTEIN: hypothetical protein PHMEG_0001666 [Phytophthora megakarya]|uniref:G-protein coupled receptors family 2 profile 2 domain-containing protein n=1 Tax=Phytophthora megakarya TaxID=4795 RepID=A0A225X178_9STRA|nr:LOW QUALITY PROTEIN: hypothetical protein PHMEG_0001666 [Phytophthora megakarya]